MTTGRINQVAFLRDDGAAWPSTRLAGGEEVTTEHEHRPCQNAQATRDEGLNPALTKHSASESTIGHRWTDVAAPL